VSKGPHSVKLVLTGKGGSVEGLVSSESQEAIAFAEVCVEVGGPKVGSRVQGETRTSSYPLTVFTDVEGRFHVIGVCPGRIGVSVRATGYAPWDGFTEVKPGETASMNVTLEQEAALTGVVRTSSGESVANARLSLGAQSDPSRRTEFSNAEGVYTIAGLGAGEFELSVDAGPNGAANLRVELQPREKRKLDIVLDPGVMLVGRVVNTAGVGLPGWAVSAGAKSGREYSTVTVATGEFSIRCDDKSPLWLSLCDSVENQAPLVILQDIMPGERPVICEIRPEDQRTASIKGRLQGEDAGPAANCRVRARKLDKPLVGLELSVESDSEGHFLIGPMQASRYALDAQSRDGAIHGLGEFTLGPEQVLDIGSTVLRRSGSFAMSLRHASGDPVREALIRVRTGDQYELVWKQYKADIDGPLLIVENLAPATYAVVVEAAGLQATTIEVVIRAGEKTNEFVVVGGP
jgi:hypothetical protein